MSVAPVTPTQDLILELLAARHRLGHNIWTLTASAAVRRALRALEVRGLVRWKHGVVEHTYLAWLTDQGREEYMTVGYIPPILGGTS